MRGVNWVILNTLGLSVLSLFAAVLTSVCLMMAVEEVGWDGCVWCSVTGVSANIERKFYMRSYNCGTPDFDPCAGWDRR